MQIRLEKGSRFLAAGFVGTILLAFSLNGLAAELLGPQLSLASGAEMSARLCKQSTVQTVQTTGGVTSGCTSGGSMCGVLVAVANHQGQQKQQPIVMHCASQQVTTLNPVVVNNTNQAVLLNSTLHNQLAKSYQLKTPVSFKAKSKCSGRVGTC